MKKTQLYPFLIALAMLFAPAFAWAGSPAPAAPLTAKEEAKVSRLMEKLERRMERKMVKMERAGEAPQQTTALDPYLKKAIYYAIIATVLSAFVWIPIAGIFIALAGLVFWVLALLQLLKWLDTQ